MRQVLLLDDNPAQLTIREMVLRKAQIECHVATNANGALALLRSDAGREKIGAVITDHLMPGMDTFFTTNRASFAMISAALHNDFSLAYILHHTNRALPTPYKITALWSGQEGSLLFWAWLLSAYGFVLRLRHKVDTKLVPHASVILAGIQVFFLAGTTISAHAFGLAAPVAADGNGLNILLQYPEMVIHPPMLYLGYVGFSVPFAFALAALIMKYLGEKW